MGRGPGLILDARPRPAFLAGHAPGAAHLPEAEWEARAAEMPARDQPFEVVGEDAAGSERLARQLQARGFALARPASPEALADRSEAGHAREVLWRPSPWLEQCEDRLPSHGRALDIACGSGRHAVWLAAHGLAAWGCDLLPDALARARAMAAAAMDLDPSARARPRAEVAFAVVDATLDLPWRDYAFDVVCGFRYLDRALFPRLVRHLVPGGWLVWETFTVEQMRFGKPRKPEFLLAPGEWPRLCDSAGLELIELREHVAPGGPALAAVLARRPIARGGPRVIRGSGGFSLGNAGQSR